jgi:hypothetical protein
MKANDKRKNNGGNKNCGRKPKAEEQRLIEKLTPLEPMAHEALRVNIENGESWAVKMFFEYMYGKPKESKDITTNGESLNIPSIEFFNSEN